MQYGVKNKMNEKKNVYKNSCVHSHSNIIKYAK